MSCGVSEDVGTQFAARNAGDPFNILDAINRNNRPLIDGLPGNAQLASKTRHATNLFGGVEKDMRALRFHAARDSAAFFLCQEPLSATW